MPLSEIRVSVLLKAYVHASEEARTEKLADRIDVPGAVAVFNRDLEARGFAERLDVNELGTPGHLDVLATAYPEARPQGAGRTIYDALYDAA